MPSIFDLVGMMHDVDRFKERTCGRCRFAGATDIRTDGYVRVNCRRGHDAEGIEDGCFDFQPFLEDAKACPEAR